MTPLGATRSTLPCRFAGVKSRSLARPGVVDSPEVFSLLDYQRRGDLPYFSGETRRIQILTLLFPLTYSRFPPDRNSYIIRRFRRSQTRHYQAFCQSINGSAKTDFLAICQPIGCQDCVGNPSTAHDIRARLSGFNWKTHSSDTIVVVGGWPGGAVRLSSCPVQALVNITDCPNACQLGRMWGASQ